MPHGRKSLQAARDLLGDWAAADGAAGQPGVQEGIHGTDAGVRVSAVECSRVG